MKTRSKILHANAAAALICMFVSGAASAAEQPAGEPVEKNGLEIMAVYLQPVKMAPTMADQDPARTDIHLEADIHAAQGNENGFPSEAWVPYLTVRYTLTKQGSDWKTEGSLYAMVASDGPHYGANLRLGGPGAYDLVFHIAPPHGHDFMHHTDQETGVAEWWPPFEYKGGFKFAGTGKKGTY